MKAFQKTGYTVGTYGDGTKDALASRQGKAGTAVSTATDVAKSAVSDNKGIGWNGMIDTSLSWPNDVVEVAVDVPVMGSGYTVNPLPIITLLRG